MALPVANYVTYLVNYVMYHVCWGWSPVTASPGPGHALSARRITSDPSDGLLTSMSRKPGSVTTDIRSLDMTKRDRDPAKRETGAVTAGSGQAARRARPVSSARFGTMVDRGGTRRSLACPHRRGKPRAGERDAWPAVVAIALGTFALVFSELIPVGLLADISGHLHVSVGTGGLMVVVPAVAAAVAAPLLALCSARLERRAVLVGLSALVLVSDVIGGLAPGIGVMLAARAVLGVCVGGFLGVRGEGPRSRWSAKQARGTAVAVVSSGIFLATVASLPTGSLIGTLTTWRAAFAVAAVFAVIAMARPARRGCRGQVPGGQVRPRSLLHGGHCDRSRGSALYRRGRDVLRQLSPPTPTSGRCCTPGNVTWVPTRSPWCCSEFGSGSATAYLTMRRHRPRSRCEPR